MTPQKGWDILAVFLKSSKKRGGSGIKVGKTYGLLVSQFRL